VLQIGKFYIINRFFPVKEVFSSHAFNTGYILLSGRLQPTKYSKLYGDVILILSDLYETGAGTFIGIRLTQESTARLVGWMDSCLIESPEPADQIHITLLMSHTNPIPHMPMKYDPTVPIFKENYNIDLFGEKKNIMVLTFESDFLQNRHTALRKKYGVSWDWPDYKPHITLTTEIQEIATDLEPPDFDLELSHEYVEPFTG